MEFGQCFVSCVARLRCFSVGPMHHSLPKKKMLLIATFSVAAFVKFAAIATLQPRLRQTQLKLYTYSRVLKNAAIEQLCSRVSDVCSDVLLCWAYGCVYKMRLYVQQIFFFFFFLKISYSRIYKKCGYSVVCSHMFQSQL